MVQQQFDDMKVDYEHGRSLANTGEA
jgi:hypothetical protein